MPVSKWLVQVCMALQEVSFGERVRVSATLRLCERDSRLNAKLLRATAAQPGLFRLTICDMLPQDLDADLVRSAYAYDPYFSQYGLLQICVLITKVGSG